MSAEKSPEGSEREIGLNHVKFSRTLRGFYLNMGSH